METIRNYLESMFADLPNTAAVQRAKDELLQMMEDKYNELIDEGKTNNEAIGIVISEFGNLDELAETLGIEEFVRGGQPFEGRILSLDEAKEYVRAKERSGLKKSIGVFLIIVSPIAFILAMAVSEAFQIAPRIPVAVGTGVFFLMLAAAIGLFVYNHVVMGKWNHINRRSCSIDYTTAEYLHNQRESGRMSRAVMKMTGILLCVVCFVPLAVMGTLEVSNAAAMMLGAAILLLLVGFGVMLLISSKSREKAYRTLLRLNDRKKVNGNYVPSQQEEGCYDERVEKIMDVYYPTVLCIYLCWSFLTFAWYITWIIWPVAAILKPILCRIWQAKAGKEGA